MATVLFICFIAAALCVASAATTGDAPSFTQYWSKVNVTQFPGGTFKASNIQNFPGSTNLSATYVTLYPGGLRELHWHNEVEWAVVMNETCRSNEGHMVQGLADGCVYHAGYNTGTFDDLASPSASSALSMIPSNIAAQALGIADSANVSNSITSPTFTFTPLGPVPKPTLDDFRNSLAGGAAAVPVSQTHRIPLKTVALHADATGGCILLADKTNVPISKDMCGAIVYFAPGGMRHFHWHSDISEWQIIINGTVEAGVITGPGNFQKTIMGPGDAGYAPEGSAHCIKALGNEPAYAILMFDQGQFTNIEECL